MYNHRLFVNLVLVLISLHLASPSECNRHSNQDEISFDTKVRQSPFILIGISLNKNIDFNIPNLFNVTFLVQCILKGRPTKRIIHIVQAGSLLGRRSCQRLDVNREHVVFLEPFFDGTYRPVDLEEVPYNNQVNMLLAKTCGLSRTYPFTESNDTEAILTNKCPSAVSIDCPLETPKATEGVSTTTAVLPTITTTTTAPMTSIIFAKSTMDLEALSLLLAEHQYQNLSLAFLQDPNHKSLFSDEETRKNQAHQFSVSIITRIIQAIFCSILHRFL